MKKLTNPILSKRKEKKNSNIIFCNDIELIMNDIHLQTGYNKTDIRNVIEAQFRMLKDTITSGGLVTEDSEFEDFKSIRLIRLGSFRPSKKKFDHIKNIIKKENNGSN